MAGERIVVVEDAPITRAELVEMIAELGYQVVGDAADGQAAIEITRQTRPDLVIMDWDMPHVDGIEATKTIAEEGLAPVLLVTGHKITDALPSAVEAGVAAFLSNSAGLRGSS